MRARPHNHQSGAALIEFALVISLLLLLLGGMYEFGRTLAYYDALSKATRDAARSMSVAKAATINSVAVADARSIVKDAADAANLPGFDVTNVTVTCLDSSYNNSTCTDGTAPGGIRVGISNYYVSIGQSVPLPANLVGRIYLTPHTTMRYMQ
jgi:Flp pilus assembly protein TadG